MSDEGRSVSNSELASLCRQFSALLHAEINILEIFEALRAQTNNPYLREILDSVREDAEMGATLAVAFSRYPQTFSPFFVSMVRQGEIEGELDRIMGELADHFDTRLEDKPDASRLRGMAFDWETATSALLWVMAWGAVLVAACLLGTGLLIYAQDAVPGNLAGNVCLLVGVILLLAVLLISRGRYRSR